MTVRRIYDRLATEDAYQLGVKVPKVADVVLSRAPIRVACDNAASWFWTSTQNDWTLGDDTGPIRLPFDEMWFEWEMPMRIYADHEWGDSPAGYTMACYLRRSEHVARDMLNVKAHEYLTATLIVAAPGAPIGLMPWSALLAVDRDGALIKWSVFYDQDAVHLGGMTENQCHNTAHDHLMPALIAVGMMNCKNVSVREVQPAPIRNRAQRKRGEMRFSYHVIELPTKGASKSRAEARREAGEANALHLVRGHFKTYTGEAPLFGSRTGTYWWGWHERGSVESGVSLHDYSVATQDAR